MNRSKLVRLLTSYLARMGVVLFVGEADTGATSAAPEISADGAADLEGGATQQEEGEAANDGDAATRNGGNDHDKTIRKLQRRIDNRSRALGQRDAENAELRRRLEAYEQRQSTQEHDEGEEPQQTARRGREQGVDVEERAREIAREHLDRQSVAERTTAMLERGKKLDKGFRELALDVAEDLPFVDAQRRPTEFIKAVLDTDNPEGILAHLGKHPDEREDLAGLSPTQMARRLAKLEIELAKKPPQRSNAARPLDPVSGRGDTSRDPAGLSDAEWLAQRRAPKAPRK